MALLLWDCEHRGREHAGKQSFLPLSSQEARGTKRTKERDRTEPLASAFLNPRPPMRPHPGKSVISASATPWALESSLNRHSSGKSTANIDRCYSSLNTPRPNYEHKIEILTSTSVFSKAAQIVSLSCKVLQSLHNPQ